MRTHAAFQSLASNLDPADGDTTLGVFVRDLQTNTTTPVSRASGAKGNSISDFPAISAEGRFVAFESTAKNLHPDDTDTIFDVFRRDVLGPPPSSPPLLPPPPSPPPPPVLSDRQAPSAPGPLRGRLVPGPGTLSAPPSRFRRRRATTSASTRICSTAAAPRP